MLIVSIEYFIHYSIKRTYHIQRLRTIMTIISLKIMFFIYPQEIRILQGECGSEKIAQTYYRKTMWIYRSSSNEFANN